MYIFAFSFFLSKYVSCFPPIFHPLFLFPVLCFFPFLFFKKKKKKEITSICRYNYSIVFPNPSIKPKSHSAHHNLIKISIFFQKKKKKMSSQDNTNNVVALGAEEIFGSEAGGEQDFVIGRTLIRPKTLLQWSATA
jgi:hypothetical protein